MGTPNKVTGKVRDAIAVFAEGNVERLQDWLDRIAEDDPSKAADIFIKLLEYHVPKLTRTDSNINHVGEIGVRQLIVKGVGSKSSDS